MLIQEDYQTHSHFKFLVNYHFVWIQKRKKKALIGKMATRTRQILAELAIFLSTADNVSIEAVRR